MVMGNLGRGNKTPPAPRGDWHLDQERGRDFIMDGLVRRGRLIVDPDAMAGDLAEYPGSCQTKRKRFPSVTSLGDADSLRVGQFPGVQSIQPLREVFTCANVVRNPEGIWRRTVYTVATSAARHQRG